jgi:hypothetical protein
MSVLHPDPFDNIRQKGCQFWEGTKNKLIATNHEKQ